MEQGCSRDVNAASFTQRRDEKAFGHPVTRSIDLPQCLRRTPQAGLRNPDGVPYDKVFAAQDAIGEGANGQIFVAARHRSKRLS